MLEAAALAKVVTSVITPAAPYLLKAGDQVWAEASKKMGVEVWEGAKALWTRLLDRLKAKPGNEEKAIELVKTATDLSNNPSDEDAQAAFRFQLKKILTLDPELCSEIAQLLNHAQPSAQANTRVGGVDISSGSTLTNLGNIVGGNQTIGS
jgi:hypothetical protein